MRHLTPAPQGWLWSRLAFTASNFVIEVEFKVSKAKPTSYPSSSDIIRAQVSGDSSHLFGDGLAIWLTKERTQPGPVFGNKDEFEGLGIFLDTLDLYFIFFVFSFRI